MELFYKKGTLKNVAKLTLDHLCQSPVLLCDTRCFYGYTGEFTSIQLKKECSEVSPECLSA